MNPIDIFEGAHKRCRRTGPGRGVFWCEAHNDKSASGSYSEADDGRLLICCHAGCSAAEVVEAVGLTLADLFPPRPIGADYRPPERRPVHAEDALRALAPEMVIACLIIRDASAYLRELGIKDETLSGVCLNSETVERLFLAHKRIARALELATGQSVSIATERARSRKAAALSGKEEKDLEVV